MPRATSRSRLLVVAAGLALVAACASRSGPGTISDSDQAMIDRTAMAHAHDAPAPTPASATAPAVDVTGEAVVYATVDGKPVTGYVARPTKSKGNLPGIIVIHEWWGLNDNIRAQARRLAGEGYVTLAVDLYNGQSATQPGEAIKLMQGLTANAGAADDNLRQAYDYLAKVAKAPRIGTIGWCLGGHWSFETALLLPDKVDATVIDDGQVKADDTHLAKLKMPILGLFAAKDSIVPVAMVETFRAQMQKLGKPVDIHIYEGAAHAFANPSGGAYDAAAAEDAWRRTTEFFRNNL